VKRPDLSPCCSAAGFPVTTGVTVEVLRHSTGALLDSFHRRYREDLEPTPTRVNVRFYGKLSDHLPRWTGRLNTPVVKH
jgi:hypothetical protein